MGRSQESFQKKEVKKRKEKKRKDKEKKRLAKKENEEKTGLDDMIAYVDENGMITDTAPDPDKKEKIKAADIEISIPSSGSSGKQSRLRQGTLVSLHASKGFGFINETGSRERIFVRTVNMIGELSEGNKVSFEIVKGQKGPEALKVKKL